ncbi:MAG: hypothetical protein D6772_03220, partial [Bacteroidetes bacterium]
HREAQVFSTFQQAETENARTPPTVPPARVRTMAEWEEVQALVLSWAGYWDVLTEIVRFAVDECDVYILTPDRIATETHLLLAGISLERVHLLPIGFNSIWMRDYGPWAVYHQYVDSLAIADYLYNRPDRTDDDLVPHELADHLGLPLYNADDTPYRWIHAGGNFLRDGLGTAWSSDLVLKENTGKSGLDLAEYARLFFGIEDYRILPRLPYDRIHHLDMHMRVLDEETIAIGQYPAGVADGPQIEANLRWLQQHYRTPYGNPYHILRLPVPAQNGRYPPQSDYLTYSNALFVNSTLLVPVYGHPLDSVALQIYRDYLPGYRVVGINCNSIIEAVGALHCVAKVVGVANPLYLAHARLRDTYNTAQPYQVRAQVHYRHGVSEVNLYYRTDSMAPYQRIPMTPIGAHNWHADIPPQTVGTEVQYYLEARALDGKVRRRPLPAPEGYYRFRVKAYHASPQAKWYQSLYYLAPGTSLQLFADIAEGATSYEWTLAGGNPAEAHTAAVEVSYPEPGIYPIRLQVSNPLGVGEDLRDEAVRVLPSRGLFHDEFTDDPAAAFWWVDNSEAPTSGWVWTASDYCYGGHWQVRHTQAAKPLERAHLRTAVDLRNLESATLNFSIAHAADTTYQRMDELRVHLTTADGQILNIYNKGGLALKTHPTQDTSYMPTTCTEWRRETIDLRPWLGQQIVLHFEAIGGQGNTLFLDDISLTTNKLPEVMILNPVDDTLIIAATDQPVPINLSLLADDADGEVEAVEVYVNEELVHSFLAPPYLFTYTLPGFGRYCIQARVRDNEGATNWSATHCLHYVEETVGTFTPIYQAYGRLFPNPVGEELHFQWNHPQPVPGIVATLYDARGREWRRTTWQLRSGQVYT